jgi:hypothetical protein
MSEEIDKHVLKKYEVQQRLGKGVSPPGCCRCRLLLLCRDGGPPFRGLECFVEAFIS